MQKYISQNTLWFSPTKHFFPTKKNTIFTKNKKGYKKRQKKCHQKKVLTLFKRKF